MSPSSVLRATARRPLRHIYAEKEHLKTLSLIKEASNMNNHRQIKDYRWKRPKEDEKLKRERSPKMSHPRWRQSRPEHRCSVVPVPISHGSETRYTEQIGPGTRNVLKNIRKVIFLANFSHFCGI